MGKKFGSSWSWKLAFGFQKLRQSIARFVGMTTTKLSLERNRGSHVSKINKSHFSLTTLIKKQGSN